MSLNEQEKYEEEYARHLEFSDDEEEEEGHTIKNAAQYLKAYNPPEKYGGMKNDVNMKEYFNFFLQEKNRPDIAKYSKKWEKQGNYNQTAIRMTGKNLQMADSQKDDADEDEWNNIIGKVYDLRMEQLAAKETRKQYQSNKNAFDFD